MRHTHTHTEASDEAFNDTGCAAACAYLRAGQTRSLGVKGRGDQAKSLIRVHQALHVTQHIAR